MNNDAEKGFTLLELLLVLGIIALIVAVAIPNFRPVQDEVRLEQAVRQFEADLMFARELAREEKKDATVKFVGNTYEIEVDGVLSRERELPPGVQFEPPGGSTPVNFTFDKDGKLVGSNVNIVIQNDGVDVATITVTTFGRVDVNWQ